MAAERAIFIDKDGTLIHDVPFNVNPDLIRLSDNGVLGLLRLQQSGFKLIVISNQSGIALGLFEYEQLIAAQMKLVELLNLHGIEISGFYYCPHHPNGIVKRYSKQCYCRKPATGLLIEAAREHSIDLHGSWMIGDILHDVEAGNAAGCKTVLINNGNETEWQLNARRTPDFIAVNINDAAQYILD